VKLLLATHNALVLWNQGQETVLHSGEGVYYGITWSPDTLYVVARGNQPSRMRVFAPNMWPLDDLPFEHLGPPGDGPHQALWWDGALYVTNTQRNRVEIWRGGDEIEYLYFEEPVDSDVDHVNSIWREDHTGHFWVAEHRLKQRPKRFRVLDADLKLISTIDLDLDCLTDGPVHNGLHNVYVEDGTLHTLGPSQLALKNFESQRVWEVELPGIVKYQHYLRGLARTDSLWLIGVSQAADREHRGYGPSSVLALDDDFKEVYRINLDKRYGQLMEIRILDAPDYAHNGVRCPLNA